MQPTIFYLKRLIREASKKYSLAFYCDLHGHSKSSGMFMLGNTENSFQNKYRIFPYLLSKMCPLFSFPMSRFQVDKAKQSTGRITLWKEMGISNAFTLEASFFGPELEKSTKHYEITDYTSIGKQLCLTLLLFHRLSYLRSSEQETTNEVIGGLFLKDIIQDINNEFTLRDEDFLAVNAKDFVEGMKNEIDPRNIINSTTNGTRNKLMFDISHNKRGSKGASFPLTSGHAHKNLENFLSSKKKEEKKYVHPKSRMGTLDFNNANTGVLKKTLNLDRIFFGRKPGANIEDQDGKQIIFKNKRPATSQDYRSQVGYKEMQNDKFISEEEKNRKKPKCRKEFRPKKCIPIVFFRTNFW